MKTSTILLSLFLWTSLMAEDPCGMRLRGLQCCHRPVIEATCCGETNGPIAHPCDCAIQAPSDAPPVLLPPSPNAPRIHLAAVIHTREEEFGLFRTPETTRSRFPLPGDAPPRTEAAYLQIWRC